MLLKIHGEYFLQTVDLTALQGEKGEWTNEDEPIVAKSFEPKKLTVHIANMDGMYALYAITYNKKKFNLNCNSPTPKLFDFQVLKGSECQ